jgi:arginine/serine-rich splicing factor 3
MAEGRKLYVGNLEKEATKEELEELFSKYGKLESVWVARKPAGFAFLVCLKSLDLEIYACRVSMLQ